MFLKLHGEFHVKGRSPDGDSIAFKAKDANKWKKIIWKRKKPPTVEKNKPVQLRIEAIDALETHYDGFCQPKAIAEAATDSLLKGFGVKALTYNLNFTKIVEADDAVPGTIFTKGMDGFDRPVSFAVEGHVGIDGEVIDDLSAELVRQTVNYKLAESGFVYPAYYFGISETALEILRKCINEARQNKVGIWAFDQTSQFVYWGPNSLIENTVVFPKIFRRFVSFAEACDSWDDIGPYLKRSRDKLHILSSGDDTSLDKLITIDGRTVSIDIDPNDVMFGNKREASGLNV